MLLDNERIDDLQLNGLKIIQNTNEFMFGTDSVLLADFCRVKSKDIVLDIGSGTGILGFLLFGRQENVRVLGIDIQEQMVKMAMRSLLLNQKERENNNEKINIDDAITFKTMDLKAIDKSFGSQFSLVVCNPPYEKENTGRQCAKESIAIARYEKCCTLDDILKAAAFALNPNGRVCMVYKAERIGEVVLNMEKYGIALKRIQPILRKIDAAPKLILVEGMKGGKSGVKWLPPLVMYSDDGDYSKEMLRAYND